MFLVVDGKKNTEYFISSLNKCMNNTPYTYLIGWKKLDIWYYGRRTAKDCHPDEFWKTYFTSSEYVSEFRKIHGEPDVIKVHKVFTDSDISLRILKCINQEKRFLRRMKVVINDKWLNADYGDRDTTGLVSAKNKITGESLQVESSDHRLVTGEFVGINYGITFSKLECEFCLRMIGKNNIATHQITCYQNPNRKPGRLAGKTIGLQGRKNMSENHADVSGANNPRAVWWRLTSPDNEVFEFCGNLDKVIKERGIGVLLLRKHLGKAVPQDTPGRHPISKKTIGWKLEKMNSD
jgi:hypothetical protein